MALEYPFAGVRGRNPDVDTFIPLWDADEREYKIKANSTTKRLELVRAGVTIAAIGAEITSDVAASVTLTVNDGSRVYVTTAATTYTLPAVATLYDGWNATFFNAADVNMIVTAPANKLVAFNNAAATSIAFSTTSEKIGSGVKIIYDGVLTKYLALPILGAETATPTIS